MRIVNIRNAPAFVPQYLELRNRYAENLLTEPVSEAETREWLRTAAVEIVGLVRDDEFEGAALLYLERGGEIAFFARRPGMGMGSHLLQAIEDTARKRGLASVWAWVRKENVTAQRAFEKNGYVPAGVEARKYHGEELQGILYRKRFARAGKSGALRKRVVLFGMTGAGNHALKVLLEHPDVDLLGVFTPKRKNSPFPYYACEKLQDAAVARGIALYEGLSLKSQHAVAILESLKLDLIVVSTFEQIINKTVIALPKYGVVNVHPSLLPKYRGATPTVCALLNGEQETGITVHFISDETIDTGRIISQVRLPIDQKDTDGTLRLKLARLSEDVLPTALDKVFMSDQSTFAVQDDKDATYCPRRGCISQHIDVNGGFQNIMNTIRALTPYPGAALYHEGKRYRVLGACLGGGDTLHTEERPTAQTLLVNTREGMVEFRVVRMNEYDEPQD